MMALAIGCATSARAGTSTWAEYETVRTLVLVPNQNPAASALQEQIIRNVPEGIRVLLVNPKGMKAPVFPGTEILESAIDPVNPWARDFLPHPVRISSERFSLVDAQYSSDETSEPDRDLAKRFAVPLLTGLGRSGGARFEHGNFLAARNGDCFLAGDYAVFGVEGSKAEVYGPEDQPESFMMKDHLKVLRASYGCKRVILMPASKPSGVRHIDERLKIVGDGLILTDRPEYRPILESLGYLTALLPQPDQAGATRRNRNYVNSILLNGTVLVPVYGVPEDQEALEIYKRAGFEKVVPLDAAAVLDAKSGGPHCLSMTFPF